jgi:hypothetical protein
VPGPTIKKIPADFAALLAIDWPRSLAQAPDKYSGTAWVERRQEMRSVVGLQLALIHGDVDLRVIGDAVRKGLQAGVATLAYRYRHSDEPNWLKRTRGVLLDDDCVQHVIEGERARGVLFAWAAPLIV